MRLLSKIGVFVAAVFLFACCFYVGVSLTQTTPKVANFFTGISSWEYQVQGQTVVYYADGTEMGKLGYRRQYSEDFPEFLEQAVVAVEDVRFYQHKGFDAKSIGRAIYNDLKAGSKAEGGSTITQQLARTIFLTNEKSYSRKIKELFIAVSIEDKYTKDAILNMYLNEVFIGRGCSGMAAGANTYFGKDVSQLNKAEMTILAGIIQSPGWYSPDTNLDGLKSRQQTVVNVLIEQGIISEAEGRSIMKQKLNFKAYQPYSAKHPYYMSYLSSILEDEIGAQRLYGGGLKIYTTIDSRMQLAAESAVAANASSFSSRGISARDIALVSIDPVSGGVKAMVGGSNWSKNQVNMAVMPRQPGSVIKPLYYAAAIDAGIIKPDTVLNNKKRDFNGYSPDNYSASPDKVTAREALIHSYNVASVEVLNKLGVDQAIKFLSACGITSIQKEDHNLALGLGGMSRGISPLQMAAAYTIFPNQGKQPGIHTVIKVVDTKNKVLFKDESVSERVMSSGNAKTMDGILKAVVSSGTGSNARVAIASGGKTGTTEGAAGQKTARDLWYVGYTSELVTAVWVGNSDNSEIKGFGTYGGTVAGPVWRDYMNRLISRGVFKEAPVQEDEEEMKTPPVQPEQPAQPENEDINDTTLPNGTGTDEQTDQKAPDETKEPPVQPGQPDEKPGNGTGNTDNQPGPSATPSGEAGTR
ncbi:MAG: PBP1A family penicillin-binding protein [Syntrophomonadaceae bacterium]